MTKKERNEAIEALLYLTDAWETACRINRGCTEYTGDRVARDTLKAIRPFVPFEYLEHSLSALYFAEAAALLLDGWNPGDPVEAR